MNLIKEKNMYLIKYNKQFIEINKMIEIWQLEYLIECTDKLIDARKDILSILKMQKAIWKEKINKLTSQLN